MPPEPALPVALLKLIDGLCDVYERGLQAGTPLQLEPLLATAPEQARPALFRHLLGLERDYRQQQGRPLTADEAARRFLANTFLVQWR